jgi:thiamine-monophosphate kinase
MKDEEGRQSADSREKTTPSSRSEFDFIKALRSRVSSEQGSSHASLIQGIGDDAAVFRQNSDRDSVISTDLLVEDIDFRRDWAEPRLLGHKALAVSLSDIAAMGARPRWSLCSVGVPQDVWDSSFVDEFYEGLFALAERYDVNLIGGDISRTTEKIAIDSIVIGECDRAKAVTRNGAEPGDRLFITGSLGGATAGLRLLERGVRLDKSIGEDEWHLIHDLLLRQLCPQPRVGWGLVLGHEGLATAMIDVSDGLSSDLHHLCDESNVGATVQSANIPVNPVSAELCGRRALDPLMLALHGGEDFELLFTVSPENVAKLPKRVDGIPLTEIGEIRPAAEGIRIAEGSRVWELQAEGWKHF